MIAVPVYLHTELYATIEMIFSLLKTHLRRRDADSPDFPTPTFGGDGALFAFKGTGATSLLLLLLLLRTFEHFTWNIFWPGWFEIHL